MTFSKWFEEQPLQLKQHINNLIQKASDNVDRHHSPLFWFPSHDPYQMASHFFACCKAGKTFIPINPESDIFQKSNLIEGLDHSGKLPREACLGIYSSGTTGKPKLILHSWRNIISSIEGSLAFYQWEGPLNCLQTLSVSHIGGFMQTMRSLLTGGSVFKGGSPSKVHEDIIRFEQIHTLSLVPTQLQAILNNKTSLKAAKRLKFILVGGAKCSDSIAVKAIQLGLPISLTYGSTETCAQVAATKIGTHEPMIALPYREIKETDGAISIKGGTLLGVIPWGKAYKSSSLNKGFYASQDIGAVTNGHLTITGRRDDIFQCGGENISPAEIKAILPSYNIDIVPLPDERLGHIPVLVHHGDSSTETKKIIAKIQNTLIRTKQPRRYIWMKEGIATNKLSPAKLLEFLDNSSGIKELETS